MDESVWRNEPYTEQDRTNQVQFIRTHVPDGQQIFDDAQSYVAGINAYIGQAKLDPLMMPAEYDALGMGQGPQPFRVEDLVSVASLVGGIFGVGGGGQLSNALLYQGLRQRFGPERAALGGSPEAPAPAPRRRRRTRRPQARRPAHRAPAHRAPVEGGPADAARASGPPPAGVARSHRISRPRHHLKRRRPSRARPVEHLGLRDAAQLRRSLRPRGSHHRQGAQLPLPDSAGAGAGHAGDHRPARSRLDPAHQPGRGRCCPAGPRRRPRHPCGWGPAGASPAPGASAGAGLLNFPREMSNALLVSGRHSASGHPLAVMGPQVSYFTPQILMEEDIHGPGIDADGAAFPGVNLYVELGHGADYAWSATSSGQNIVDTFAAPLCNPTGGPVSTQSSFYCCTAGCVPMETLTRIESWQPNLADSTPAGQVSLQTQRTAFGLVIPSPARESMVAPSPTPTCAPPTCTSSTRRSASSASTSPD